jgi:transcription initiation factor IIE alpha subunit
MTDGTAEYGMLLREAYHDYGEFRCAECGAVVDLSDADSLERAAEIGREHFDGCPRAGD